MNITATSTSRIIKSLPDGILADAVRALSDEDLAKLVRGDADVAPPIAETIGGKEAALVVRNPRGARAVVVERESVPSARTAAPKASKPGAGGKPGKGAKRDPADLAALTDSIAAHIESNPGQGVEQIAKALSTTTKELTLPIRKLLADKKIFSKGQKRATRYFPK